MHWSTRCLWMCGAVAYSSFLCGAAEPRKEPALGLVLSAGAGALFIPAGSETPLALRTGDVLLAGDAIRAGQGPAKFLFCPSRSKDEIAPASEVVFQPAKLLVRSGKLTNQTPTLSCALPNLVRLETASQQHYGATFVRGLEALASENPVPPEQFDAATRADLAPLDAMLAANANDAPSLVARATTFEKHGLPANALADLRKAALIWPEAVWIKGKIFELQEALAAATSQPGVKATAKLAAGKTYAILVGISKYQKLPQELWLHFAEADARAFRAYLASPRGGAVQPENLTILTDEQATTAAVRHAFQTFLRDRAGPNDTVVIVIAAHGTVEVPGNRGAYVVTYDTDPQDLGATGFPMVEIQDLIQKQLANIGRVLLFVDACHSGSIGSIKSNTVNASVQDLGQSDNASFLGFMASLPKELSRESADFGGGHGAFTYFVLKGLNQAADGDGNGIITQNELVEYVRAQVPAATAKKQHPREFGTLAAEEPLADLSKPVSPMTRLQRLLNPHDTPVLLASTLLQLPVSATVQQDIDAFRLALRSRKFVGNTERNAIDLLAALRPEVSAGQFSALAGELSVALEDDGQQVLLRYLQGDQIPQTQADFARGAADFQAASGITPGSLFLDSRVSFFEGRRLLFEKKYRTATDLLERSIRIDPSGAYAYNALGIAYLEQADFPHAVLAFRDALRRAPQWTYPYHNLALASIETGDYDTAIHLYLQAIKLTPQFSYLHYNLGLVYERINRRKDAESEFQKSIVLSPGMADAYNAMGSLRAAEGKANKAEEFYRRTLSLNPNLSAARQNLGLLLASRKGREAEAITVWRENVSIDPEFLPSRISLAQALGAAGDTPGAIAEWNQIIQRRPEYVAARLAVADLLLRAGSGDAAAAQVKEALRLNPSNPEVLERAGDVAVARGDRGAASHAYRSAIAAYTDPEARKRLKHKIAEVGP